MLYSPVTDFVVSINKESLVTMFVNPTSVASSNQYEKPGIGLFVWFIAFNQLNVKFTGCPVELFEGLDRTTWFGAPSVLKLYELLNEPHPDEFFDRTFQ